MDHKGEQVSTRLVPSAAEQKAMGTRMPERSQQCPVAVSRSQRQGAARRIALVACLACSGCFGSPNYEGLICLPAMGCPAGYECRADQLCHGVHSAAEPAGGASSKPGDHPITAAPGSAVVVGLPAPIPASMGMGAQGAEVVTDAGAPPVDGGPASIPADAGMADPLPPMTMPVDAGIPVTMNRVPATIPDSPARYCSLHALTPAMIRFINTCSVTVTAVWVDFFCNETDYASVQPGQTLNQDTHLTQSWRVRYKGQLIDDLPQISSSLDVYPCGRM